MGYIYRFICDSCNYSCDSAGKKNVGINTVTKPYVCNDCNEVCDVIVGELGVVIPKHMINSKFSEKNHYKDYYRCFECNGKNLTKWKSNNYKCPKCDTKMHKDENFPIINSD